MNHREVRASLGEYLEGDLDLDRRALLDGHLDGCRECRRELDELVNVVGLLRALPDPQPPRDLAANVMRRVRAGEADASWLARVGSWIADLLWPGLAIPTAAMVAALAMALYTGRIDSPLLPDAPRRPGVTVVAQEGGSPVRIRVSGAPRARSDSYSGSEALRSPTLAAAPGLLAHGELVALGSGSEAAAGERRALSAERHQALRSYMAEVRRQLDRGGQAFPRSADDWLTVLSRSPARFVEAQAALSEAEQELWARQLARRAVDRGVAQELAGSLERSDSADARTFAKRFLGEVESYRASR